MKTKNVVGLRFGRWVVISDNKGSRCESKCDCGSLKFVDKYSLTSGISKSCGCLRDEIARKQETTHGLSQASEYSIWNAMLARCENINNKAYYRYGGKGITVCDSWKLFSNFIKDMGFRPTPLHSIDRIDNDLGYSPDNCRWATYKEQNRNYSKNTKVTYFGEEYSSLIALTEKKGCLYKSVHQRIKRGWSVEKAIDTPLDINRRNNVYKRYNTSGRAGV